jgi:hypothetical protein
LSRYFVLFRIFFLMGIRRRLTVGLFFGALLFLQIAFSIYVDLYDATQFSIRGWRAEQRDGRAVIDTVIPDGPATVLQIGDEPLAVTSPLQDRMPLVSPSRWRVPSGTNYTLRVQRQGEVRDFALQTRKVPLLDILPNLTRHFFNLIFLATGLFVFILKPTDKQAILLALMLGLFTGILSPSVDNLPITLQVYVTIIRSIALLFLPVFLHFFLIFPERSPLLDRFPRLERWLYLPVILVMFAFIPTRMPQSLRFFDSNTWFIGRFDRHAGELSRRLDRLAAETADRHGRQRRGISQPPPPLRLRDLQYQNRAPEHLGLVE